jgi:hypothetical protein
VINLSSMLRSECPSSALRPVRLLRNILISILCVVSVEANALSINALSINALSINALSINALSINALSINRLDADTLLLDADNAHDLIATAEGRHVLRYIVRCALEDGDYLRFELDGRIWDMPGLLGIAPEWERRPLSSAGQERMSACLLAHVNAFGIAVPISMRGPRLAEADVVESSVFYYGDGAFYGNLFDDSAEKFACKIRANRYFDESTQTIEAAASPTAHQRICAGERTAAECGMVFAGYCDEVCDEVERDGNQWRFGDCLGTNGQRYEHAFTVWLEGERAESCDVAPVGFTCNPN